MIHELKVAVACDSLELLEELLSELGDQRLMLLEDKPTGHAWLAGYFDTAAEAAETWCHLKLAPNINWGDAVPETRELPDADWKNSYKAHFKASKFGRLNWVPVWEKETFILPAGEEVLWLDPGMAFGTGNHETTRLCCERLADFALRRGSSRRVIDAGCGSGILALSAARLGFSRISAFDNDPEAIKVSEENARMNGLAGQADFFTGDLVSGLAGRQAELVLANIQADVLMRFADELWSAVAPGGELVLSGILGRELAQVREKFSAVAGGGQPESRQMGEWADLKLVR